MCDTPDGSKCATVNVGWTQVHLGWRIYPLGFFLLSQMTGCFFQLRGIVANSVHERAYDVGFIHSYAIRLRVMIYDCDIRIIDTKEEEQRA